MFRHPTSRLFRTIGSFSSQTPSKPSTSYQKYPRLSLITASFSSMDLIKKLRSETGAPIVECKKAVAAEGVAGNYEKAAEWLRKNGSAKAASKVAGRDASEGLVGIAISKMNTDDDDTNPVGAIVRVASETDFASRSPAFTTLVKTVAESAIKLSRHSSNESNGGDLASRSCISTMDINTILGMSVGKEKSVKDVLDDTVLAIRENIQIANVKTVVSSRSDAVLAGYVHGKVDDTIMAGNAAAIVELIPTSSSSSVEEIHDIGKKLAMHIVAAKPTYLSPDQIPEDVLDKEREILMEQMKDTGKSTEILQKIVSGRLRKFYEQVCLTEQDHMVEEGNPKISKFMKKLGLELVHFESDSV